MKAFLYYGSLATLAVATYLTVNQITSAKQVGSGVVSAPTFEGIAVQSDPDAAIVRARYRYWHKYEEKGFVWRLTVLQGKQTVFDHFYDEQYFVVPKQTLIRPTFTQRIPLTPGTYRVVLGVYEARPEDGEIVAGDPVCIDSRIARIRE